MRKEIKIGLKHTEPLVTVNPNRVLIDLKLIREMQVGSNIHDFMSAVTPRLQGKWASWIEQLDISPGGEIINTKRNLKALGVAFEDAGTVEEWQDLGLPLPRVATKPLQAMMSWVMNHSEVDTKLKHLGEKYVYGSKLH